MFLRIKKFFIHKKILDPEKKCLAKVLDPEKSVWQKCPFLENIFKVNLFIKFLGV